MSPPIRVFVFDPVRLAAEALGFALRGRERLELIGHGHELGEVCRGPVADRADLILACPPGDPVPSLRAIKCSRPLHRLVVAGVEDRTGEIVRLIEAGASGYVTRGATPAELARVVEDVFDSTFACPPEVTRAVFDRVCELSRLKPACEPAGVERLSGRERQIVAMIGRGLANKEIARELRLALHTVKNHVHRILHKLQVRRRRDAAGLVLPGVGGVTGMESF